MKINNVELKEIDLLDADTMENIEEATNNVLEDIEEAKKTETLSSSIRKQCIAIFDYFNTVFGEGTDKKLFGDKTNLRICLNAFKEFQEYINEQISSTNKDFSIIQTPKVRRRTK